MRRHLLASLVMLLGLTVLLGFGYPLLVAGLSALLFSHQAQGSLVYRNGKLVGSSLLGQSFASSDGAPLRQYFQPRPSNAGTGYNAISSGASNLGPSNPLLIGFVPGVNTVGLNGKPSSVNPFATAADPACVPTDAKGVPVTSPAPGQRYAKNADGSYLRSQYRARTRHRLPDAQRTAGERVGADRRGHRVRVGTRPRYLRAECP
jgi:potassium-transporting ATPase KdpC subunit